MKTVKLKLDELLREHERLIPILKTANTKKSVAEANIQTKEFNQYKAMAKDKKYKKEMVDESKMTKKELASHETTESPKKEVAEKKTNPAFEKKEKKMLALSKKLQGKK